MRQTEVINAQEGVTQDTEVCEGFSWERSSESVDTGNLQGERYASPIGQRNFSDGTCMRERKTKLFLLFP